MRIATWLPPLVGVACCAASLAPSAAFATARTQPTVTIHAPTKAGSTLHLAADASDDSGTVARVAFLVDGTFKAWDTAQPFAVDLDSSTLSEGTHTVAAVAFDAAGNTSPASVASVQIDHSVNLTVKMPVLLYDTNPVTLTYATDGDVPWDSRRCGFYETGQPMPALGPCTSGIDYTALMPRDGSYTLAIQVTDDVGNSALWTHPYTVDMTPPVVTFTNGPTEGGTIDTRSTTVGFTVSDAHQTMLFGCAVDDDMLDDPCTSDTSEQLDGLTDGPHSVTVRVIDFFRNLTTATLHFRVEVPPPAPTPVLPPAPPAKIEHTAPVRLAAAGAPDGRGARIARLALMHVPAPADIVVTCAPRRLGCPFAKRERSTNDTSANLAPLFGRRSLRRGAVITVRLTTLTGPVRTWRVTVRGRGHAPLAVSSP